jgi:Holliday junction resolvase RusA-like endonuclease
MNNSTSTNALQVVSIKIFGNASSKSNSRRIVRFGGMSRMIKSQRALDYSVLFKQQCPVLDFLLTGDLKVTLHIWYDSRRPDLDETLILDLMQGCIYENDRQVKERHCYWHLDTECPRAEIVIEQIPDVHPQKKAPSKRKRLEAPPTGARETMTTASD